MRNSLREDCGYAFSCSMQGGYHLSMSYMWGKKAGVIERIEAYITGINPFTGKELKRNDYLFRFSAVTANASANLALYGDYILHFDAFTCNGQRIEDFCQYKLVVKNDNCCPYIRYRIETAERGWTRLKIESNCFNRLQGKLWLSCSGRLQRLPDAQQPDGRNPGVCYCLARSRNDIQLVLTDQALLKAGILPQRI